MLDPQKKRVIIIGIVILSIVSIVSIVYFLVTPKLPIGQQSDKTVIIDNYADYTKYISSKSFGSLGNYLYRFIHEPDKGVYHAEIVKDSYSYASDSWFSTFNVKVKDSDISWAVSLQTLEDGSINGDINIQCLTGGSACLSLSEVTNTSRALQDYLPISTSDYIIAYKKDNYDALSIVYYDQDDTGKTKALEKIKSLGFKPEDYPIEYFYGGR